MVNSNQEASSFLEVPLELQHSIFLYLTPLDVISVGSTCKDLFNATNDHTLWVQLLDGVNFRNRTFLYGFGDHLSLRELKHAATRPARMLRRLEQNLIEHDADKIPPALGDTAPVACLTPVKTTMFDPRCQSIISRQNSCLFLVPGGHLLVASVDDCLSIWDLDVSPPSSLLRTTCISGFVFLVTPSKDQKTLYIAVSANTRTGIPTANLSIYTYSLSCPNKMDVVETELEVQQDYDISVFTLVGDLFVYLHNGHVHLWDHVHNTFSSWTLPPCFNTQVFPEVFVCELGRVVVFGERWVLGWDIPKLVSKKEYNLKTGDTLLGILEPVVSFDFDLTRLVREQELCQTPPVISPLFCETTHDWYNAFSSPGSFDIIWTTCKGRYDYFTTIVLRAVPSTNICTARVGQTATLPRMGPAHQDRCLDSWRICETSLIKGCFRGASNIFDVMVSPLDDAAHHGSVVARLGVFETGTCDKDDFDRFWFSFEPTSGRACYFSVKHQKIVVVDYLGM